MILLAEISLWKFKGKEKMKKRHFYVYLAFLMFVLSAAVPVYAGETEIQAEKTEPETEETEPQTGETELETELQTEETEPETESETELQTEETEPETEQTDFEIEGTTLTAYHGTSTEVSIPEGVTEIGPWCFFENQTIQKVILPGTVRTVGYCAFYGSALKEAVLPEGLETIDQLAFYCDGLSRIRIPRSVKEIGDYAFSWGTFLECYAGTAGFAYAKENQSDNSLVLDAPKNFSSLQITLAQTDFVYDGHSVQPEVSVLDGSTVLKEETDYTVQYGESIKPGVYTVTVQAMLSEIYTGSRTLTYTIRPRTVRHLVSGLGTSSQKAVLQWNKSPEADGYEVSRYDSRTKKWVLVKQVSETSCTDTNLKADTAYKYRVQAQR